MQKKRIEKTKPAQKIRNSNHVIEPRNKQKTAQICLFGSA